MGLSVEIEGNISVYRSIFFVPTGSQCLHVITDITFLITSTLPWRWRQNGRLKCWYPTTTAHSVTNPEHLHLNHHGCESLKIRIIYEIEIQELI